MQVDAINKHGQGLLQSAASGVSTSLLEGDLETLNDKWSDINERVSYEYPFLVGGMGYFYWRRIAVNIDLLFHPNLMRV